MPTFDDDESGYIEWCESHPYGYVLNTNPPATLHRVGCMHLNSNYPWPVRLTRAAKVCEADRSALVRLQPELCSTCKP